jgi:hypothetical protein
MILTIITTIYFSYLSFSAQINEFEIKEKPAIFIEESNEILQEEEVEEKNDTEEEVRACILDIDPVVGEDGKIYNNSCFAKMEGVEIDEEETEELKN